MLNLFNEIPYRKFLNSKLKRESGILINEINLFQEKYNNKFIETENRLKELNIKKNTEYIMQCNLEKANYLKKIEKLEVFNKNLEEYIKISFEFKKNNDDIDTLSKIINVCKDAEQKCVIEIKNLNDCIDKINETKKILLSSIDVTDYVSVIINSGNELNINVNYNYYNLKDKIDSEFNNNRGSKRLYVLETILDNNSAQIDKIKYIDWVIKMYEHAVRDYMNLRHLYHNKSINYNDDKKKKIGQRTELLKNVKSYSNKISISIFNDVTTNGYPISYYCEKYFEVVKQFNEFIERSRGSYTNQAEFQSYIDAKYELLNEIGDLFEYIADISSKLYEFGISLFFGNEYICHKYHSYVLNKTRIYEISQEEDYENRKEDFKPIFNAYNEKIETTSKLYEDKINKIITENEKMTIENDKIRDEILKYEHQDNRFFLRKMIFKLPQVKKLEERVNRNCKLIEKNETKKQNYITRKFDETSKIRKELRDKEPQKYKPTNDERKVISKLQKDNKVIIDNIFIDFKLMIDQLKK